MNLYIKRSENKWLGWGACLAALIGLMGSGSARAASVLVIPPDARGGAGAAAEQLADDLVEDLRGSGIQAGLFDPSSPAMKLALVHKDLAPAEIQKPNEFTAAFHLARIYGADFVLFGNLTSRAGQPGTLPANLDVQLNLGDLKTTNVSVVALPSSGGLPTGNAPGDAEQVSAFTRQLASAVAQRIAPAAPANGPSPAELHWREYQRLMAAGDAGEAGRELSSAISLDPENGSYKAAFAKLLFSQGQGARAITLYQDAATAAPFDADIRLNLAKALETHGDTADALAAYRQVAALAPGRPGIHLLIGRLLLRSGDGAGAASEFELADRAGDPGAAGALVDALLTSGDLGRARSVLEASLHTASPLPHARERLAELQLKQDNPEAAIKTLLDAVHGSSSLSMEGLLAASSAMDKELTAVINLAPAAPAADLAPLRTRIEAVAQLADSLPASNADADIQRRRSLAASEVLQAITELQHPIEGKAAEGDVAVLLSQARQLLNPKTSPPAQNAQPGGVGSSPGAAAVTSPAGSSPTVSSPTAASAPPSADQAPGAPPG